MQVDLNSAMVKLEKAVVDNFEMTRTSKVDQEWLESTIDKYYNKDKSTMPYYIVDYADSLIADLPYRVNSKGSKGVSESTVKKYKTIRNKLENFERFSKP